MKPYVHRERNWASLDECKYIINELGPKTYIYSDNKGKPFDYKSYFFNGEEILKFLPNFGKRVQFLLDTYTKKLLHCEVTYFLLICSAIVQKLLSVW